MFVLQLTVGKATFQTGNWCCMVLNLLLENHCTGSPDLGTALEKRGQNATKSVWVDALVLIRTSAVAVGIINWLTGIRYAPNRFNWCILPAAAHSHVMQLVLIFQIL